MPNHAMVQLQDYFASFSEFSVIKNKESFIDVMLYINFSIDGVTTGEQKTTAMIIDQDTLNW